MANYCSSCGVEIPDGQKSCSMCYGDIDHGTDGHYRRYLEEQQEEYRRQEKEREMEEERRQEDES